MRSTSQWASRVAQTGISRATIREVDDNHLCQECKNGDVGHSETHSDFEVWQPLGVTSVPMKQKEQQGQQGQQGGQGGGGGGGGGGGDGGGGGAQFNKNQPKGEACEMVMLYANGQRAHPIGMPQDRRCRPYDMDPGEGGNYDVIDGKQMSPYFRNRGDSKDGVYIVGCDAEQQQQGGGGSGAGTQAASGGGQSTDRLISIAYTEKKKQSRKPQQQQGGGQSGGSGGSGASSSQSGGQQQQRYKHEGDSVDTEVRLTKKQIQFYKKASQSSSGGGAAALADSSGGGSSGGSNQRQDGELRGYWDNDSTSWWWKADSQITHDADQQITLKSAKIKSDTQKKIFTGDVHIMGNLYVGKEGYKPTNSDWLAGQPDPSADDVAIATPDPPSLPQQLEARRRRLRIFEAISVDDDGNVSVKGDLQITGNLTVGGVIRARDFVRSEG
jgi:hypothetical protein